MTPSTSAAASGNMARRQGVALRRMRLDLGTFVAVEALAVTAAGAQQGIEAAFAAIAELGRRLHPSRPGSDLYRINSAPAGALVPVHRDTLTVLTCAQRLNRLSGGLFDPCVPTRPGRLAQLQLRTDEAAVRVGPSPVELDCGGIAKGFAVDQAIGALRAAGCTGGLVNAGGDLRLYGALRETVLLRSGDGQCNAVALADAALAVSEVHPVRRPPEHRGYYVRDGFAAASRRFAAVRAPAAMTADALTKCALLGPPALTRLLLREFGAECVALS
jgi:thiamine biosynthesis lipoprotein